MKRNLIMLTMACVAATAAAKVTIEFPVGADGEYSLESRNVNDLVKPRKARPRPVVIDVVPDKGKYEFGQSEEGATQYILDMNGDEALVFYTVPCEDITINIKSVSPLDYTVKGSALMEGISQLRPEANRIEQEYAKEARSANPDKARMESLIMDYVALHKNYIHQNPENPASVYALLQLDGADFITGYELLTPDARLSPLYVMAESKKESVEKGMAAEKRMAELQKGTVKGYDFTLPNPEGKPVSLGDFKGKWVILDFWGGWCPWCIKGFPALKEAYSQYSGKLEIIGIDCNESESAWKEALAKYELPWVQVYNSEPGAQLLYDEYAVQGFPTKIIVNPEGYVVNVTVGEDPSFFTKLANFLK